jgi:5-methyltetrahydrofolate--homocysteine methyltransferase
MGGYDETPENFANNAKKFCLDGIVNMIGGCCGTTPSYIKSLWEAVKGIPPRVLPQKSDKLMLSGMQEFIMADHIKFINVGERCNISGSV